MTDAIQIFVTFPTREDADRILRALIEQRLAACVQIYGPITSTYHWQGNIETSEEWLGLIKTTAEKYTAVEQAIKASHPYTVPEILAVSITDGNPDYLAWLNTEINA